jgi:hypothetical protein
MVFAGLLASSCSSPPTDLRSMVPADALVYLESNDLYAAVAPILESRSFQEAAAAKPDLSPLKGIQLAVAVTGFEVSEEPVNEEGSVGKVQPKFVAVADTHAWSWQTRNFAENQLGEFINKVYGGGVKLETNDKPDGRSYVWTAEDGRRAFALVSGSLIFFGNDESSLDRCLAVRRGEGDPISKIVTVPPKNDENVAIGYIAPDGISQLSNIAGLAVAVGAGEDADVKSFVARVLPQILRSSVKDANWTSVVKDGHYEDHVMVSLSPDISKVFAETMVSAKEQGKTLSWLVEKQGLATTHYYLKDPQIAWRSAVLSAQTKTDPVSGKLIAAFSSSLFEPYAIEDPEMFLSSVGNVLQTVRFDAEGEDVVVIGQVKDLEKLKKSVAKEVNFAKPPERIGEADVWKSADGDYAAAIVNGYALLGDGESVVKLLQMPTGQEDRRNAAAVTTGVETDPAAVLVDALGERKSDTTPLAQSYTIETRFDQNGIQRVTTSDFGLIGSIIEHLGGEK